MSKIAILADSSCQIEINGDHPGIYIVPLLVTINDKTYLDQLEITSVDVFKAMDKDPQLQVATSQPSTGKMVEVINNIKADGYDEILAISIGTGLSSTINGMKVAAEMADMPITLVDTKATAWEQRVLVETADQLIKKGKTIPEILPVLNDIIDHSGTVIMVPNMDHLARSGRVTKSVALLANLLKIVPVLELKNDLGGKIDNLAKVRTLKKAHKMLADRAIEMGGNAKNFTFAVESVLADESAKAIKEYLESKIGQCQVLVRELPSVVGVHMGIGGVGLQYVQNPKI